MGIPNFSRDYMTILFVLLINKCTLMIIIIAVNIK